MGAEAKRTKPRQKLYSGAILSEIQRGCLDEALALMRKAVALNCYPAEAYPPLIEALLHAHRRRDADVLAAKVLEAFPDRRQALHVAMQTFHRTKNAPLFRASYKLFLDSAALYKRFEAELNAGDFAAAFKSADGLIGSAKHFEVKRFLNMWGDDTGRTGDVREMLKKNLRRLEAVPTPRKNSQWCYFFKATLLFRSDSPGFQPLSRRIRAFDGEKYGWMRSVCGKGALHSCDLAAARRDFEAALESRPREWMIRCMLAETLACTRNFKDALGQFDLALEENPEAAGDILSWKGEIQLWAGDYSDSLVTLDRAVKGGAAWAYCWRGGAKIKSGKLAEGIADLKLALKHCETDAEALCWLGEAYRLKGLNKEALRFLDRSIALNANAWAYANRALLRAAAGDISGFEKDFNSLPGFLVSFGRKNLKLGSKPLTSELKQRIIARCFALSHGNRRSRDYEMSAWAS